MCYLKDIMVRSEIVLIRDAISVRIDGHYNYRYNIVNSHRKLEKREVRYATR